MRKTVTHISTCIILIVMLMPAIFMAVFAYQRSIIMHEMKEKLEEEKLEIIVLNENEVQWVKPEKEIAFKENMFDVKEYKIENGKFYATGLYDIKEKELNARVNKQMEKSTEKQFQLLLQFFQLIQNKEGIEIKACIPETEIITNQFLPYSDCLLQNYLAIQTPPPKC